MYKIFPGALILILSLSLFSCDRGPFMKETIDIPNADWNRFNTLWFDYTPEDHTSACTVELSIRYQESIPSLRLEIMGTIHTPSGEMRFREYMIHFQDAAGTLLGAAIEGQPGIYEQKIMIRSDFVFKEEGNYRIEIENLGTKFDNPGIVSVALSIERKRDK